MKCAVTMIDITRFFVMTAHDGTFSLLNPYLKTQPTLGKCAVMRRAPSFGALETCRAQRTSGWRGTRARRLFLTHEREKRNDRLL